MGIRSGIAGSLAAVARIIGIGMFLYGAWIFGAANPPYDPFVLAMSGALIAIFVPHLVRSVAETILCVR